MSTPTNVLQVDYSTIILEIETNFKIVLSMENFGSIMRVNAFFIINVVGIDYEVKDVYRLGIGKNFVLNRDTVSILHSNLTV